MCHCGHARVEGLHIANAARMHAAIFPSQRAYVPAAYTASERRCAAACQGQDEAVRTCALYVHERKCRLVSVVDTDRCVLVLVLMPLATMLCLHDT